MSKKESKKSQEKKGKGVKLDKTKQNEIKEKAYSTRQVETSIAILESPENDVVLESLLFLSKYADVNKNNIVYLQRNGLLAKLMMLFQRNICILRLALRMLGILLSLDDAVSEIDQDIYDDGILEISQMYIDSKDAHIKLFCADILANVAKSYRINTLIFRVELLVPIFDIVKTSKNEELLELTLKLLLILLDAPAAVSNLPETPCFDAVSLASHINKEPKISDLVLDIFEKLSAYGIPFLQNAFKQVKLVEKMLDIVMDSEKKPQHSKALNIIYSCLNCEETNSYFIESIEFLKFCQWVKICPSEYLLPSIDILLLLSNIAEIKQVLFDLSVEDAILYCLRSTDKKILNKTCQAISNMSVHKYCCDRMLTPVVLKTLIEILERKGDEEDVNNTVALRTLFHFSRRNVRTLDMVVEYGGKQILMEYFYRGMGALLEESYLQVLEIIYKLSVRPDSKEEFMNIKFFSEILRLMQSEYKASIANLASEILSYQNTEEFRKIFLSIDGPMIILNILHSTENLSLLKNILIFIISNMVYEDIAACFLRCNLISYLKDIPECIKNKAPLIERLLELVYSYFPPIKFFEKGRLEICDKLQNKFYIINGNWTQTFPFLDILEMMQVSTIYTIYVVDYSMEIAKVSPNATLKSNSNISKGNNSSLMSTSSLRKSSSIMSTSSSSDIFYPNPTDPYLPRFINHAKQYVQKQECLRDKVKYLAEYVDTLLCGPKEELNTCQKIHTFKLHIEALKFELETNVIPIGYLRLGFHLEKALMFKALADKTGIPTSLVRGNPRIYWNEVALLESDETLRFYVVDLMEDIGNLLPSGGREANSYCNIKL